MKTTIDKAGRLVIPKKIRQRLGLRPGEHLEVSESNGAIEIARPQREVPIVKTKQGLRSADPDADLPGLGPDEVRELLERTRR